MDQFLNKLERRFGSWAVPGLIRYLGILFVGVYLLGAVFPHLGEVMDFNLKLTLAGEIWRPLSFVFAHQAASFSPIGAIFLICMLMLMFIFSDGLEAQWGVFRTNLFVLWGYLSALIGAVLLELYTGVPPIYAGAYIGMSVFFAFATYNPRFTIMLFLVIPTPIWILAAISGVVVGLSLLGGGANALFTIGCLSNYLLVAVPMRFTQARMNRGSMARKRKFQSLARENEGAFNTCAVCGATDISHPDQDFRVGKDGKDYCIEHLPKPGADMPQS